MSEPNAAFVESVRMLLGLHALFVAGRSESPEAHAVRAAMERPWYAMTDDEQRRVEQLSADLYTLGERSTEARPAKDVCDAFARAQIAEDWDAVLALLLEHPGLAPPAERAALRGRAWAALGAPEAAAEFDDDAKRARRVDFGRLRADPAAHRFPTMRRVEAA